MENLPIEIVEYIIINSEISIGDIINLSSTCQQLYRIISDSNKVWKYRLFQRWPQLKGLLENRHIIYKDEIRYIYELRRKTRALLEKMPPMFYNKYEISESDLEEWTVLLNEREEVYNYLVFDLMEIINTNVPINSIEVVPLNTPGNKTLQYYAGKVLRHIRQNHLSYVWKDFISLPSERQILEIGACFVAQWCQPTIEIYPEKISAELDNVAEKVKDVLKQNFSRHPLFKASAEELALWRVEIRPKNEWEDIHCRQIINAMREVIFQSMGFVECSQNPPFLPLLPEDSYINVVLEKGRGLTSMLIVVFEAVARRLGLRCEPIIFPSHFLLRFCEGTQPQSDWYYIDVSNGGQIVRKGSCPQNRFSGTKNMFPMAEAPQVIERIANDLEVLARQSHHPNGRITRLRSSLEMLKVINPKDISALVSLARLYMLHKIDARPLENFLITQEFEFPEQAQRVIHMLRDYQAHLRCVLKDERLFNQHKLVQRTPAVRYAVGMIMRHKSLSYKCVIYNWDLVCLATLEWQIQNNVDMLSFRGDQAFYNVLVEDGTHRYTAQENLIPALEAGPLNLNDDIGRHFSHFFQTHYVPNAEKETEYPDDKLVRFQFYHQKLLDNYQL